jgi:tetratricopeptide (TPR) repeat protein
MKLHRSLGPVLLVTGSLLPWGPANADSPAWLGGWLSVLPSPQQMLQGQNPVQVQEFSKWSTILQSNPNDVAALDRRGYYEMEFARKGLYRAYWQWLAARDLEQVIQVDPNDFFAWHNYGQLNYMAGDLWATNDHSNARRAISAFTRAIAINPISARSYMGRGWAYLTMGDEAHATVDFQTALQLDQSLRPSLETEVASIRTRKAQEAGARATLHQMSRYYVERSAHTSDECQKYRGFWAGSECRISMALYPGPRQPWEATP